MNPTFVAPSPTMVFGRLKLVVGLWHTHLPQRWSRQLAIAAMWCGSKARYPAVYFASNGHAELLQDLVAPSLVAIWPNQFWTY
jgi:hypothetical protein